MEQDVQTERRQSTERVLVRRGVWHLAFAVAALVLVVLTWRLELVFDDAFISFRYSKHLANGEGLRFNLGTNPPVEGYSNLLWVLWCTIPELFSFDTPKWALWSNLLCGLALVAWVLLFLAKRVKPSAITVFATALFLATLPSMAVYSTGGLETMAFALALFIVFERLSGEREEPRIVAASVAAAAAVLLRPDGVLWAGVLCALVLGRALRERDLKLKRAAITVGVIALACFGAQTAWRYGYHGDWLPNTVRAKASMSAMTLERGGKYALSFLVHYPAITLALLLAIWVAATKRQPLVFECLLFVVAMFAYVIAVGGDFLPMGRFLLPALPFVAILFACMAERCTLTSRPLAIIGVSLFIALSLLPHFDRYSSPASLRAFTHYNWNFKEYLSEIELLDGERRRSEDLSEMGRALKMYTKPTDSIVIGTVGAAGYYSDLFIFDQFGLVNREVAAMPGHGRRLAAGHDRYAPAKFFKRYSPTYAQVSLVEAGSDSRPVAIGVSERLGRRMIPLKAEDGFRSNKTLLLIEPRGRD